MIAIILGVALAGIALALVTGAELGDLPWGAIILAFLLAGFIALRARRMQRRLAELDEDADET